MTLSAALAKTAELYPSPEMRRNLKISGDLILSLFGDIPTHSIDEKMLLDLPA